MNMKFVNNLILGCLLFGATMATDAQTSYGTDLYFGTYNSCRVMKYDTVTKQFTTLWQSGFSYVRGVDIYNGKVYAGISTSSYDNCIYEIDMETGAKKNISLPDSYKTIMNNATVTVSDGNSMSESFNLSFEVTATQSNSVIPQTTPPAVYVHNGLLYMSGLTTGETLNIYNISGALVYQTIITSDRMNIPWTHQGIYIVQTGNNRIKFHCGN